MLSSRLAHESDLSSIIDIYTHTKCMNKRETFFNPHPTEDCKSTSQNETLLLNRFREYINKKDKGIYLTYFKDTILGFSTFEPDPNIPDCLFISNFYFDFSKTIHISKLSEKDIESIKTGMLLFLMNKASEKKYHKMSIISDNYNGIHKICMSYNAKVVNFCGMMYSYDAKLLFENI